MPIVSHTILAGLWILFGVLHSLLAAPRLKAAVQQGMGRYAKYYTFLYSIFATATLAGTLIYQASMPQIQLWPMPEWALVLAAIPLLAGLFIMAALIKKYFFALSGISAFYKHEAPVALELGGWHRFMRHPLYFGTLLFVWSIFLMVPLLSNLIACAIITIYTLIGTILEERKLVSQFGQQYADYQRRVPMLLPTFRKAR